ncbi:Nramp family divalent metal transporter [Fulvivirga lutea]|uniref:Nramp family divalent metal transporter n=1 Tax=Fulvivirga lutea TaxID=2810512 RepID=A0A975A1U7_9BACT|nr:Nramp family divalent metal transporter [Fulvivirga lutea]QSE97872.1 Nramp family divalent metal transporter [Fulvivirga lutea]
MQLRKRLTSILIWSVISAAFIGPGTLATATSAGSQYGLQLIWPLVLSTIACLVIQEMSARVTISSGRPLGNLISDLFSNRLIVYAIGLMVITGCLAYQAGNILGAVSGISLIFTIDKKWVILLLGLIIFILISANSFDKLLKWLGYLVALMGIFFLFMAFTTEFSMQQVLVHSLIPSIPEGSSWLVIGLIGTTIVPYNIFLGSGIGEGRTMADMRFGLTISVVLGGLISIAILIIATNMNGRVTFLDLANYLGSTWGNWAYYLMGFGLFAAGLTSSITSPVAAALIAKSVYKGSKDSTVIYVRVWQVILISGLIFGLLDFQPIPIIIAAQAFNGLILPALVSILFLIANNKKLIDTKYLNSNWSNIVSLLIIDVVTVIGFRGLHGAMIKIWPSVMLTSTQLIIASQCIALLLVMYLIIRLKQLKTQ